MEPPVREGGRVPLAPLLAGIALSATPASLPAASAPAITEASSPAVVPARQVISWRWTDGSLSTERTFAKRKYHTVARIPKVDVKVYPAFPPWKAKLLFWVNGAWVPRQQVRSDDGGHMLMSFDPIGPTGTWENITWIVRIRLMDVSQARSAVAAPSQVREIVLTVHYVK